MDSISFLEKVKQEIIMSSNIIGPSPREKVAPSEKVTPTEEVEKGIKTLDDMDNTKFTEKLELPVHNDSVTPNNRKKKKRVIILMTKKQKKDPESPSDKIEESREKLVAPISEKEKNT